LSLFDEGLCFLHHGLQIGFNSVLKISGHYDVVSNFRLPNLIRNFGLERPLTPSFFPKWDLAMVLRSLLEAPYEPMASATLGILTQKTMFLVALASGGIVLNYKHYR